MAYIKGAARPTDQKQKDKKHGIGFILAGGASKRLFPLDIPKPLLRVGKDSLLEQALRRLHGLRTFVVCNKNIAAQIRKDFRARKKKIPQFIIEPEGRDTAAAVGFALKSVKKFKPTWIAIVSADQWFPEPGFDSALQTFMHEIGRYPDSLFLGGSLSSTKPSKQYSQFGWMIAESATVGRQQQGAGSFRVKEFVEKPQSGIIAKLISQGGLINAGMFFGRYDTFLRAYETHYPLVLKNIPFSQLERRPIDKAIFEKFHSVRVVPLSVRWEDLGTWSEWARHIGTENSRQVLVESENIYSHAPLETQIFVFGCRDLVIVQDGNRILVMPLSKSSDLKNYLEKIKK